MLCYYFSDAGGQEQSAFAGGRGLVADVTEYAKTARRERKREWLYQQRTDKTVTVKPALPHLRSKTWQGNMLPCPVFV